jgi:hypothetical protein
MEHDNDYQGKKSSYTQQGYMNAVQARKIQNIIMHPCDQQFGDIVDKNCIRNLNVIWEDIRVATDIFGPNIGSLYGKTIHKSLPQVHGKISDIPPEMKEIYSRVVIGIDVLYLNKIPFLVTTSRNLHFGTFEELPDRKIQTVGKALCQVIDKYSCQGCTICVINADCEFAPLQGIHPHLSYSFTSQNEHVPEVESCIRTIKD